jgi:predicted nucleotidyltransferase
MILRKHQKIIKKIVNEKRRDPKVISILLFGSLAKGTANKNSDIDIEIIHSGEKYSLVSKKREGIKVDMENWPKKKLIKSFEVYPFLKYPYLSEKILYDPMGFAKKFKEKIRKYFNENKVAKKTWANWEKEFLELKKKGKKPKDVDIFYRELKEKLGIK